MLGCRHLSLTDTWLKPKMECWELQRTGGVELTFRNTVISTPGSLAAAESGSFGTSIPALYLTSQQPEHRSLPQGPILVHLPRRTAVSLGGFLLRLPGCGVVFFHNLALVEHGVQPVVHRLDGSEDDTHH